MKHRILAIIHRHLVIAEVTRRCTGNGTGKCPTCGELNQYRDGWYGCWACEIEYSIAGLQRIEDVERKVYEYANAL